jgi:hypothetical protein
MTLSDSLFGGDFIFACGGLDSGHPPSADSGMTTWHLKMKRRGQSSMALPAKEVSGFSVPCCRFDSHGIFDRFQFFVFF